ncbi:hypothetical protein RCL1_008244 [Eukaryota sp. TZLM3-RCL]
MSQGDPIISAYNLGEEDDFEIGDQFGSRELTVAKLWTHSIRLNKKFVPFKGNDTSKHIVDCDDKACCFHLRCTSNSEGTWTVRKYTHHHEYYDAVTRHQPPASIIGNMLAEQLQKEGVLSSADLRKRLQRPLSYSKVQKCATTVW